MVIDIIKNSAEKNMIDKSNTWGISGRISKLETIYTYNGEFRNNVDIVNPVIVIADNLLDNNGILISFNYFYIPAFNRTYFLTSLVREIINGVNVWTLSGHVDVLFSFRNDIIALSARIARNETYYNTFLPDGLLPATNKPIITYSEQNKQNSKFYAPIGTGSNTTPYFLAVIASAPDMIDNAERGTQSGIDPLYTPNKYINPLITGGSAYIMSANEVNALIDYLNTNTNIPDFLTKAFYGQTVEGIVSIYAYPYNLTSELSIPQNKTEIKVNNHGTGINAYKVLPMQRNLIQLYTTSFPSASDFRDLKPYRTIQIYLPYIGWDEVNPLDAEGSTVRIIYNVDYFTGDCMAYVIRSKTGETDRILIQKPGKIGASIPLTSSNALEVARNNLNSLLTGAIGLTASAMSGGAGALGTLKAIESVGMMALHPPTIRGQSFTPTLSQFEPTNVQILETKEDITIPSGFASLYGRLDMTVRNLSDLKGSGFTVIDSIHLEGFTRATDAELDEIESLLHSGVIL